MEANNFIEHQYRRKLDFDNGENDILFDTIRTEVDENEDNQAKFDSNEYITSIHSKIPVETIPKIDMEFETKEEAYNFYNAYAYKVGFSIRRSKGHKGSDGKMINRTFCCSCEGRREVDNRRIIVKHHRAETRFHCLTIMKVNCHQTGKYRVVDFIASHTHVTSTPSKSHLHRSQRRLTAAQEAEIDLVDNSGIAPKDGCELMTRRAGGRESLEFTHDDYRNYLRTKRTTKVKLDETGGILEYLQRMQLEDPSFFYALQLDNEGLITNIFWRDAQMKVAYSHFGDVIYFDTTYQKNQESRPFAMFVGVNHHKQTILFGAALLYDETAETFIWLFDTFVRGMVGKKPMIILTDQDAAMAKALSFQWPQTSHRPCIWHLYQNAAKHLSVVFERFREFSKDFSRCIYDYEEEKEFLQAWHEMLEKYNLQSNNWLKRMFSLKEKWALVYGRDMFCADMMTTQRNESMNSSIKGYVSYKHNLSKKFHHFQRLFEHQRYEKLKADFKATQSNISLPLNIAILKHAANVYTRKCSKHLKLN
ncbi:protein FAR1-RELATED SEQUENCE 5-like [Diospyros lotus]|uniref:protein FAR1-RELATED SEQUENCE 5-like n=1 Tax=Diospyros lotus TaxID=55363 RepID=UPI00224C9AEB|nr:protein FAR1-RELATED SEQUENCE 5-like [Diospyros lotus]